MITIDGVALTPSLPQHLHHLVPKLQARLIKVAANTNPDYIRKAIYRELKMFRVMLMSEHNHFAEWASATIVENGQAERIEAP